MATARFAWGIDIGNRALKAIKLVHGETGLRIDDFEVIEHENVLSNSGDNKDSLIRSALANFVQRHPVKGGVVGISVSGVSSFARFIKLPPVEKKKIPEIVKFEAVQQIPFPLAEVEWSYQLFQAPDSPDVEVGIFAMRKELINQHIQYFTEHEMNVQVVQMNPLAVFNAMYYDSHLDGATMIVDLGAENTDLIIADGDSIWLRSIPIGGNNFTEVLVKSFKLPFAKAEELKRNANTSKYARQIFQAMRPVFADLVAEIQRSMGFYASGHRESKLKKIIALGGTFRLAGLQKYLQQNLQLDVEKLTTLTAGAPADAKMATTFNQNLLSLVSAYGLAIQAMGEGKLAANLLPEKIRREKMWQDKTKWFGLTAAGFIVGAGLACAGYYAQRFSFAQSKSVRDANDMLLARAQDLDGQWSRDVESAGGGDRLKITNARSMLDYRELWPEMLTDIYSTFPPMPAGYADGNVDKIKQISRADRQMIWLDSMASQFAPDISAASPSSAQGAPAPGPSAPGAAAAASPDIPHCPGYLITLNITTPHKDGYTYVLGSLIPSLQALGRDWFDQYNTAHPDNPKRYYIAKVYFPTGQTQLKDDSSRMQDMAAAYQAAQTLVAAADPNNPAKRMNVNIAAVGSGQKSDSTDAYLDSSTKEDRENDWEMKVQFLIALDPPAKGAAGSAPAAAPGKPGAAAKKPTAQDQQQQDQ